jgi:hypothetical protein
MGYLDVVSQEVFVIESCSGYGWSWFRLAWEVWASCIGGSKPAVRRFGEPKLHDFGQSILPTSKEFIM